MLTKEEKHEVVTNCDHLQNLKFSTVTPRAFTEHGAIMVASVLNSPQAIEVSDYEHGRRTCSDAMAKRLSMTLKVKEEHLKYRSEQMQSLEPK